MTNFIFFFTPTSWVVSWSLDWQLWPSPFPSVFFSPNKILSLKYRQGIGLRAKGNRSLICVCMQISPRFRFFIAVCLIRREGCTSRRRRVFSPRVFCARKAGGGVAFPQCRPVLNLLKAIARNRKFTPMTLSLLVKIIFIYFILCDEHVVWREIYSQKEKI